MRLPDNSSGECNPAGDKPCCDRGPWRDVCGNTPGHCICEDCVDYRIVQDLRASNTRCTVARVGDFLKTVCSDVESETEYEFKCTHSDVIYRYQEISSESVIKVSKVCDNDKYAYQSCVYRSQISKSGNVLCGGYHCVDQENNSQFIQCEKDCTVDKVCPKLDGGNISPHAMCDQKCDDSDCFD